MLYQLSLGYVFLANLTAVIILLICNNWSDLGRFFMICVYLFAIYFNIYFLFVDPNSLIELSQFAFFDFYKSLMTGFLAQNFRLCLILLTIYKIVIILCLLFKESLVKIGSIASLIYFLMLAPLGVASGFPSTLFLAIASYQLYRRRFKMNLISSLVNKNTYHV